MEHKFTCYKCGRKINHVSNLTTGYGLTKNNHKVCYECCAIDDVEYMCDNGKITLYLDETIGSKNYQTVCNWPGTLRFNIYSVSRKKTNWGLWRTDFKFAGPDGHVWWGYQIGENTQIAHCKRTKEKWKYSIYSDCYGYTIGRRIKPEKYPFLVRC